MLLLIFLHVDTGALQSGDQFLHQGRRVDEAEDAVAEDCALDKQLDLVHLRVGGQIADALAGQGQVLAVRGGDDAVADAGEDPRNLGAVIAESGIRLVGDGIDLTAELAFLALQDLSQGREAGAAVDHARRIVRGVENNGPGLRADGLLDGRQIGLERPRVGPDLARDAAVIVDVELVFDEVGGEDNDLLTRVEDGLEHHVESPARPAGHDDMAGLQRRARFLREDFGHRRARLLVAGVVHVAVHPRLGMTGQAQQLFVQCRRRLYSGVAQGEVENVLLSVDAPQSGPFLEHSADPRSLLDKPLNFLRDRHGNLPVVYVMSGG